MEAHELSVCSGLIASLDCQNHQVHLGMMSMVLACWGAAFLNTLFAVAMFVNMGNHLLRCAVAIPSYVRRHIEFVRWAPDDTDRQFVEQIQDFLLRWHSFGKMNDDDDEGGRKKKPTRSISGPYRGPYRRPIRASIGPL